MARQGKSHQCLGSNYFAVCYLSGHVAPPTMYFQSTLKDDSGAPCKRIFKPCKNLSKTILDEHGTDWTESPLDKPKLVQFYSERINIRILFTLLDTGLPFGRCSVRRPCRQHQLAGTTGYQSMIPRMAELAPYGRVPFISSFVIANVPDCF